MKKLKIGLVCPYSINKHGGVLEGVLALQAGLTERGHTVRLITPMPRGHEDVGSHDAIFIGTSTDFRSPSHTTAQVSSTADNERIDAMLAAEKFDILHFHEPWVPFLSRQLLQRSQAVNIATFHSKIPESIMTRSLIKVVTPYLRSVMKYLHVLTAVSDSGAEYAGSLTDQPITIIPNGIDLRKYSWKEHRVRRDRIHILYVGRLERRKGVKHLLQAFKLLQQDYQQARLTIAGNGPDREKLELLAEDLKLQNIEFLGFISEDLKLKLLNEADLFCSPALFGESFGIVLLESMASGTVCVAGNNSGYEGVMQGVGALSLINPQDTTEFARRMSLLLSEPELRKAWLQWAKKYVKQYDYPRIIDQYEQLYKDSLQAHARQNR